MDITFVPVPSPHIADYIVIIIFLCVCMGIGVYYGYKDKKNPTLENYFFGNRQLLFVPVAMSIFVSFFSAISLIGFPAEIYMFGIRIMTFIFGYAVSLLLVNVTIVPVLYPLKLISIYEYLQLRFNSKCVRLVGTVIGMIQTFSYMGVSLYAPALALQVVAGIPLWVSIVVIGVVGTIYTAIGGIKSVVWTDVFQCVVIFIGLLVIVIKGTSLMGPHHSVFGIAYEGGRLEFFNFDLDPRVRHTNWGLFIGVIFNQMPSWCNQTSVQRILSLRNLRSAYKTILLVIPIVAISYGMVGYLGILVYSYYNAVKCDPIQAGLISNFNQLTPYFVMDVLRSLPGFSGLFISCVFSGALSSFSSGINALSANTVEDIIGDFVKKSKIISQSLTAKLLVFLYGMAATGLAYGISFIPGSIVQIVAVAFGACGGPLVGLFFLGGMIPKANWKGALVGSVMAMMLNIWISVGGIFYGKRPVKLAQNPTSGCFPGNLTVTMNGSSMYSYDTTTSLYDITGNLTMSQSDPITSSKGFFLYDISYTWYGLIGFLLTMIIGTVVSLSTGGDRDESVKVHLIFPVCRKLFGLKSNSTNESEDKTLSLMPPNAAENKGDSLISYSEGEEPNVPTL